MVCECGKKMTVCFTTPVKEGEVELRFRQYHCSNCLDNVETLEVPKELIMSDQMVAALKRGRESRYRFYSNFKKKG